MERQFGLQVALTARVNNAGVNDRVGLQHGSPEQYAASQAAILGLTRAWAVELLCFAIRVNAVVPAEVVTPLHRRWLDSFSEPEAKLQNIIGKIPLGKRMTALMRSLPWWSS